MSYNRDNSNYVVNEQQISSYLSDVVNRVEKASESEIQALDTIKKLIKKNVPFARRKYVFAYLVKYASRGWKVRPSYQDRENGRGKYEKNEKRTNLRQDSRDASSKPEYQEKAPRVEIAPELAKTIFISIGRNRRVFPRDMLALMSQVAGLGRERIGEIRVLSNYSFVTLFAEDCDAAIQKLNGYEWRGRKLSCDYSRERDSKIEEKSAEVEVDEGINNDPIPANVTNESSGIVETSAASEEAKIAQAQSAYAKAVEEKPYSETTDDGQVKSHFGDGAAY